MIGGMVCAVEFLLLLLFYFIFLLLFLCGRYRCSICYLGNIAAKYFKEGKIPEDLMEVSIDDVGSPYQNLYIMC